LAPPLGELSAQLTERAAIKIDILEQWQFAPVFFCYFVL